MKRATSVIPAGDQRLAGRLPSITLTREQRYRRRIACNTDAGEPFLLDLPEATYLPDGSGLSIDDGSTIVVRAAPEELLKIGAASDLGLKRIAWHIGNRHTPAEITSDAIYILPDHVLADMVRGLGGTVEAVSRPFEPEGGAYGGHGTLERGHHHHASDRENHASHHHAHAKEHGHGHGHGHEPT